MDPDLTPLDEKDPLKPIFFDEIAQSRIMMQTQSSVRKFSDPKLHDQKKLIFKLRSKVADPVKVLKAKPEELLAKLKKKPTKRPVQEEKEIDNMIQDIHYFYKTKKKTAAEVIEEFVADSDIRFGQVPVAAKVRFDTSEVKSIPAPKKKEESRAIFAIPLPPALPFQVPTPANINILEIQGSMKVQNNSIDDLIAMLEKSVAGFNKVLDQIESES